MILYWLLRQLSRVALRWYYSDIAIQGRARIPADGPVLLVANHPNALVDAMLVATTVRRRVLLTAKATLFERRALAVLLRGVGVLPLRRAQDERTTVQQSPASVSRNAGTFRLVTEALSRDAAILVFPEGISHDAPALAPLRTGAARMALGAAGAGVRGLRIAPIGLIYERKERLRSRVLIRIGEPIDVDAWFAAATVRDPATLTVDVDRALHRVTLNFASEDRAARAIDLAAALAAIAADAPTLDRPPQLSFEVDLAHRIESASEALGEAPDSVVRQADALIAHVEAFRERLAGRGVTLADLRISPLMRHGLRFVAREAAIVVLALPVAIIGRLAHWAPLRLARAVAMRPLARDPSRDQPAMRTVALGAAGLLAWYTALGVVTTYWVGGRGALVLLAGIFLAARVDTLLRDRLRRARQRARAYLAMRADPGLRRTALFEADRLLHESAALEMALVPSR